MMRVQTTRKIMACVLALYLLLSGYAVVYGDGGEDHGEKPQSNPSSGNSLTAVAYPDTLEVFLKYGVPKVGENAELIFFFSSYKTNVPLDPTSIIMEIVGGKNTITKNIQKRDVGIYGAVVSFFADTSYTIRLTFDFGGETIHTALTPILAGESAIAAAGGTQTSSSIEASSASFLWYIIGGLLLLVIAFLIYRSYKSRHPNVRKLNY